MRRTLVVFVAILVFLWVEQCFANTPTDWERKKGAIVGCCTQNLNANDFNEEFKNCFRNLTQNWREENRNAMINSIKMQCREDEECIAEKRQCIRRQQIKLRLAFQNANFEKPTDCEDYDGRVLVLRNQVIAENPCN